MNILILGAGGREHALYWKIKQSPLVRNVYCCPGNGGTQNNIDADLNDLDTILNIAQYFKIDLTIVGPEDPLCNGIVDLFQANNLNIFGPNKKSAHLEKSKDYSKNFMEKYKIPTATYHGVGSLVEAQEKLKNYRYPLVIKADGLCQGKGVIIAQSEAEANETLESIFTLNQFGDAGNKVIIEEFLEGREVSLICLVSKNRIFTLDTARDYKKIYDGDLGLNTGGVGAYSPAQPFNSKEKKELDLILKNIENGLDQEGIEFNGVLFIGLMLCQDGVNVLEFNVRFGDPETQVILPRLESDLLELILAVNDGSLSQDMIKMSKEKAITTILVSKGYPEAFTSNHLITIQDKGLLFHNGTRKVGLSHYSSGGRVLSVVGMGTDLKEINNNLMERIDLIDYKNKVFRKDIGLLY